MPEKPFAEPLTELPLWYRAAHTKDFPIWETRDKLDGYLPLQLGYPRKFANGQEYFLAKNGATKLKAGYYVETSITAIEEDTLTEVVELGDNRATIEVGTTTVTKDQFAGGFLQVKDHTGKGHNYAIRGNTAGGGTAGDTITVYLGIEVPVALDKTSDIQIVTSPWNNLVEGTGAETDSGHHVARGIPSIEVEANYYFWLQGRGPGLAIAQTAINVSVNVPQSLRPGTNGRLNLVSAHPDQAVATMLDPNAVVADEAFYVDMHFV